jgi:hypothetical protein
MGRAVDENKTVKTKRFRLQGRPAKLWQLRLYVMDQTPKSVTAFANLKSFAKATSKAAIASR